MENAKYTLSRLKSDVFRLLDEYSCNGENTDIYSGSLGDIEKRFISAANFAIRLVSLACDRRKKRIRLFFKAPLPVMKKSDFSVSYGEEKTLSIPENTGALSFYYGGSAKMLFRDEYGIVIEEKSLITECGELLCHRAFVPDNARDMVFSCKMADAVEISCLKCYSSDSVSHITEEKYLPDGKRLFCTAPPYLTELICAKRISGERCYPCPEDIFLIEDGTISCDEKYAGTYELEYLVSPCELEENSDDETEIELYPSAYTAAVYATAASLCEREDAELYTRLTYKYREILANCYPSGIEQRRNSFYSGGRFAKKLSKKRFFG